MEKTVFSYLLIMNENNGIKCSVFSLRAETTVYNNNYNYHNNIIVLTVLNFNFNILSSRVPMGKTKQQKHATRLSRPYPVRSIQKGIFFFNNTCSFVGLRFFSTIIPARSLNKMYLIHRDNYYFYNLGVLHFI